MLRLCLTFSKNISGMTLSLADKLLRLAGAVFHTKNPASEDAGFSWTGLVRFRHPSC